MGWEGMGGERMGFTIDSTGEGMSMSMGMGMGMGMVCMDGGAQGYRGIGMGMGIDMGMGMGMGARAWGDPPNFFFSSSSCAGQKKFTHTSRRRGFRHLSAKRAKKKRSNSMHLAYLVH